MIDRYAEWLSATRASDEEAVAVITAAGDRRAIEEKERANLAFRDGEERSGDRWTAGAQEERGDDMSEDFMFKEPTLPTRMDNLSALDGSLTDNNLLHYYRHG